MRSCAKVGATAVAFTSVVGAWQSSSSAQVEGDPDPLLFGSVRVGATSGSRDVTLTNTANNAALNVTCTIAPASADFEVLLGECPNVVPANGTANVSLVFRPDTRGISTASLIINYTFNGAPFADAVSLSGTGTAPQMVVSTLPVQEGTLDFGTAPAGTIAPTTFVVRVENTGASALNATLSESGTNPGDWSYSPAPTTFSVAPSGRRDIIASFQPGAIGARTAIVTITDIDGLSSPVSRSLGMEGTGSDPVAIALSTSALAFGNVDVQLDQPVTRTIVVTNPGSQRLVISQMSLIRQEDDTPYEAGAFQVVTQAPLQVPPGKQRAIDVRYQPSVESAGDFARLILTTNSSDTPEARVSLSGRGIDRHIEVSPTSIHFGAAYRNPGTPEQVTLMVANTGESPLSLTTTPPGGAGGESFALVGELDGDVAPRGSRSIAVEFRPREAAAAPLTSALFIINNDDVRPMVRVDLSGRGLLPPVAATLAAIDWGSVEVGLESPPPGAPLVLRNESDELSFIMEEVRAVDGTGRVVEAVHVGPQGPLEIPPSSELELDVVFAPEREGVLDGAIEVLIGPDPEPVVQVPVSGDAVAASTGGCGVVASGDVWPRAPACVIWVVTLLPVLIRRRAR